METFLDRRPGLLRGFLGVLILFAIGERAGFGQEAVDEEVVRIAYPKRTQVVALKAGWNAVWLEVDPGESDPDAVFEGTPIDIVARYFRPVTSAEFITDPLDEPYKREGWGVWYAPGRADAFLKGLHGVRGGQGYLVHATADFEWAVEGEVRFRRLKWTNEAFNLVGFSVEAGSEPTFAEVYAGSKGRVGQQVFRLVDGRWVRVASPGTARLRSGEACWVYCEGKTDYQGPLDVTIPGAGLVDLGTVRTSFEVAYANTGGAAYGVTAVVVGDGLPLRRVVIDYTKLENRYPVFSGPEVLPVVEPGHGGTVRLQLRREEMVEAEVAGLLKLSGGGVAVWVPVRARNEAITSNP